MSKYIPLHPDPRVSVVLEPPNRMLITLKIDAPHVRRWAADNGYTPEPGESNPDFWHRVLTAMDEETSR